jgi:hypothetical protein
MMRGRWHGELRIVSPDLATGSRDSRAIELIGCGCNR